MPTVRELTTKWGFDVDDRPLRAMDRRVKMLKKDLRGLTRFGRNIGMAYGTLGAGIAFLLKKAGNFEQTQIAFETLIGNAVKSKALLKDLTDFAQKIFEYYRCPFARSAKKSRRRHINGSR